MTELKCPFCGQELVYLADDFYCPNCYSNKHKHYAGSPELWQELITTRKALDVTKNAINSAVDHNIINCVARGIDPRTDDTNVTLCNALEQINEIKGGK